MTGANAAVRLPQVVRRSAALSATSTGAALGAAGTAEISEEGEWQRFLVEVSANVAHGTAFTVIVNGRPVGRLEISDYEGSFEIAASDGLRRQIGLHDVGQIETIAIATQDGAPILTGSFERGDRL